jgi:YCII-related domain
MPGAHVMLDMIGEHAEHDVGAHPRRRPVEDRPQVDVDRLQRAECAFDLCERFVGADRGGIVENPFCQTGAYHIDAVEDGPFSPTEEQVAGYWLWNVKSMDEAVEWLKLCPNPMLTDSDVEIRPEYETADFARYRNRPIGSSRRIRART